MKGIVLGLVAAAGLIGFAGVAHARCTDPRVPTVRQQIDEQCQCNGNHGQYVSCVAHAVRQAVVNGDIDTNCKGAVTRCAARSTCGRKEGTVACAICDPGTCTGGVCDDGVTVCADSTQCPPVLNRCSTKSTEACALREGVPNSGSCCDAGCVVP